MKFHPIGAVSLNATFVPVGTIPGVTEPLFAVEPSPEANIAKTTYVKASEFLRQYRPGTQAGKPGPNAVAEREEIDGIIASLSEHVPHHK